MLIVHLLLCHVNFFSLYISREGMCCVSGRELIGCDWWSFRDETGFLQWIIDEFMACSKLHSVFAFWPRRKLHDFRQSLNNRWEDTLKKGGKTDGKMMNSLYMLSSSFIPFLSGPKNDWFMSYNLTYVIEEQHNLTSLIETHKQPRFHKA